MAVTAAGHQAHGSIIPLLKNGLNSFEDNDYENFIDNDGDGLIDVGDRFIGAIVFQGINGTGVGSPGVETMSAVFAIEVLSKTGPDGAATALEFGPLQGGGGNDAIAQWAAVTGFDLPVIANDGTMVVAYQHPDFGAANPNAGADAGDALDTFDNSLPGTVFLSEFGFLGDAGEFWSTTGLAGIDNPALILGLNAANRISINVTNDNPADPVVWLKSAVFYPIPTALQGVGTFVAPVFQDPGHFDLSTDTDFAANLQVVPEPTSMLAWGLLGALGGGSVIVYPRLRRRAVGS